MDRSSLFTIIALIILSVRHIIIIFMEESEPGIKEFKSILKKYYRKKQTKR